MIHEILPDVWIDPMEIIGLSLYNGYIGFIMRESERHNSYHYGGSEKCDSEQFVALAKKVQALQKETEDEA